MKQSTDSVLGLDIGGSAIKAAPVDVDSGRLLSDPQQFPVPDRVTPDVLLTAVGSCLSRFKWTGPLGVGYPGVVKSGHTLSAAHVDDSFIGLDWLAQLRTLTDSSVALLNDADAAGLAEIHFGAGAAHAASDDKTVLVMTLGTGIGTALFRSGQLFPNTEFGHVQMGEAEAEDQAAAAIRIKDQLDWPQYGRRVNRFLVEMERLLSPDLFIIGGGISENFDKFSACLDVRAEVVPAALGNNAGLIGAALAVRLAG